MAPPETSSGASARFSRKGYLAIACLAAVGIAGTWAGADLSSHHSEARPEARPAAVTAAVQARLTSWRDQGGQRQIDTVRADLRKVSADGLNFDLAAEATDCAALVRDTATAQGYPEIPDPDTQADWSQALNALQQSAADCASSAVDVTDNGVDRANFAELTASENELTEAEAPMKAALTRLQNPTW
ncbi:hypothetical protein [Streptacidiphilus cavernicola]|uniref:Lipoprotein n=1 Tax=Streptacidiphilus cavernicola TaxID=3342716 RepID=A0ABV6W287_9ACTN